MVNRDGPDRTKHSKQYNNLYSQRRDRTPDNRLKKDEEFITRYNALQGEIPTLRIFVGMAAILGRTRISEQLDNTDTYIARFSDGAVKA